MAPKLAHASAATTEDTTPAAAIPVPRLRRRPVARYVGWPLAAVCAGLAVMRVTFAQTPAETWRADAATRHQVFAAFAPAEPGLREKAARDFPGDLWSADDAFHFAEVEQAGSIARGHGARTIDGLRAIDEGLRAATAAGLSPLTPGVPPCRPRPDS